MFNKINTDLSNTIYHPHGREIWVIDFDTKDWYFQYLNNGQLWYNQKIFNLNLLLFSLNNTENQKLLKMWFEKNLNLKVNIPTDRTASPMTAFTIGSKINF